MQRYLCFVMSVRLDHVVTRRIDSQVDVLCSEFEGQFDRRQIAELMDDSVQRLAGSAAVHDFLPSLGYRLARERLLALRRSERRDDSGMWDVVFVSLSGGGRGQLAAALTTLLSQGRVSVHSAGTAVRAEVDPGVSAVIAELGLDPEDEFAHPVTDEALRAADVIVTMGHSVGVIDLPDGVRHEDWRVGDPIAELPPYTAADLFAELEHAVVGDGIARLVAVLGAVDHAGAVQDPEVL